MVGNTLAVICARGGSKRIPRKNVIDFFGKPLIAWTIEAAVSAGVFRKVIVSTDDAEIAAIARSYGAEVPFMRERFADDHAPISQAVIDAIDIMRDRFGECFDHVAHLMANCPMRTAADIVNAHGHFFEHHHRFQISCFEYGWMNPWWAFRLGVDHAPVALHPEALTARSQELDRLYCPTGAIWFAQCNALTEARTFYGPGFRLCPMPWQSAVDIDNPEDLEMARAICLARKERV